MGRRTLSALAAAAATALLIAGCGGSEDTKDDKIKGADKGGTSSSSPTPRKTVAADPDAPKVSFPDDFEFITEFDQPADPKQAAALDGAVNFVRGIKHGITRQDVKDPVHTYYSDPMGTAPTYARDQITKHIKGGWTLTGKDRFTRPEVRLAKGGKQAAVTFCEDQSQMFGKEVKSGKILRTEPSDKDYYYFEVTMVPVAKSTVWQANSITVNGEATQCKG
ncbi:hypothetical protein [Streptomyces sp. NPDC018031]|uniref:hypothetical protein n=1 Tax=Streptomyces sp. NPDC018031 TaxID=3365033 RepID=UPI0037976E9B